MDIDRAIEIVTKLADGVDPATGESLPPSSVYQQADTVRTDQAQTRVSPRTDQGQPSK